MCPAPASRTAGVGLGIAASHLNAPSVLQRRFGFDPGWRKPARHDLPCHGCEPFGTHAAGSGIPQFSVSDHHTGVGQRGGQQTFAMRGDQLLADHPTDRGADEVEAFGTGDIGQRQRFSGQIGRRYRAALRRPSLTSPVSRQIPGQHTIMRQQLR